MAATLGVHIVGDAVGLKTALTEATVATERYAAASKVALAGVSDASLQAQLAQYKLGKATEKYGAGSVGAAQATMAYRRQVESLRDSHLRTAQSIGRGLTTYVTAPTALLGFEAVKMGIEFQRQMLLIQTQAGASSGEVKRLTGEVLKLAPAVGMGPTQLAQGLYHLESLGLRGDRAMRTLKISSLAAGMGIADLESVTTALGGAVVTGIKGAQNYQQAMATLTATVGAGNMRFGDLAGSIGNVAPAAAAAGVTLPELGASMAVLTDRGLSADEAATRLRMTFALLQSPSDKAQKALKDMGINAESLGATLRTKGGLGKVLAELQAGIERVGKARGNRDLIQAFGGGRSSLGIQILVGSLTNSLSGYQKKLEDVSKGEKRYAANQKAYMGSASFKLHQDLAEAQARLTSFGADLAPLAVKAVQAAGIMGDAFAKLPGPIKTSVASVVGLFAVGGPLILGMVGVTRMVRTLGGAFRLLPLQAGPAIAATDAEIASIGASAMAAEGKLALLRGGLIGLAALAAAPIVITVVEKLLQHETNVKSVKPGATGDASGVGGGAQGGQVFERNGRFYQTMIGGKAGAVTREISRDEYNALVGSSHGSTLSQLMDRGRRPRGFTSPARVTGSTGSSGAGGGGGGLVKNFALPYELQLAQAKAAATSSTADDAASLRAVVAFAKRQIDSGKLSKKAMLAALGEEGSALQQLDAMHTKGAKEAAKTAKKAGLFSVPLELQVAQARADALAATNPNRNGPTALQLKLAREVKAKAMRAINSHKLSMQGLIDAWNAVNQANQTLAQKQQQAGQTSAYSRVSSEAFTAGLGLATGTRKDLEERFAQIQAHGGYAPTGTAAQGQVIVENHIHGDLNGLVSKIETKQRQKHQRSGHRR